MWMRSNRLQLNAIKTEFIWISSSRRVHQLPQQPLRVGSHLVAPVSVVRNLGIYLDSDTSMSSHVAKTVILLQYSTPPIRVSADPCRDAFYSQW